MSDIDFEDEFTAIATELGDIAARVPASRDFETCALQPWQVREGHRVLAWIDGDWDGGHGVSYVRYACGDAGALDSRGLPRVLYDPVRITIHGEEDFQGWQFILRDDGDRIRSSSSLTTRSSWSRAGHRPQTTTSTVASRS